ncbi:MAG: transglycosylase SLT domain-containing protein [Pyrinomonadaceae bacterium]
MAGAERVNGQIILPVEPARGKQPERVRCSEGTGFGERVGETRALASPLPREFERRVEERWDGLFRGAWLRKRTVEELKTLVAAIQSGVTDPWDLTDLIFYARHPELKDVPLTEQAWLDEWNQISALLVHPAINEVEYFLSNNVLGGEVSGPQECIISFERARRVPINAASFQGGPHRFDDVIARAVEWCPGLSPATLKSLLAQESNFNPKVINQFGYAGIAQFRPVAAREVGLRVGIAGSATDERLNPYKAIPAAARLLNIKAQRLGRAAFSRYG